MPPPPPQATATALPAIESVHIHDPDAMQSHASVSHTHPPLNQKLGNAHTHESHHEHPITEVPHSHAHDQPPELHSHPHSHDGLAPHSHDPIPSPGAFTQRAPPLGKAAGRDFEERAFTIGIGGPVGTGKTALMLALCRALRDKYSLGAVTNDIFTQEDGDFLVNNGALPPHRIRAVETGGCPHAAIREDISINIGPLEDLCREGRTDILLCESGGDNLAANFSRELADFIIYIIDVAGGDKIPRKGGPGITQADLLVINKTDLAAAVGADLKVMERDSLRMREGGPFVFAQVKHGVGLDKICRHVLTAWHLATGGEVR